MCSQSEYARCYDARNSTWIEIEGVESDREESESEDGGEICCLRKNVMSAGIVMSGYKVVLNNQYRILYIIMLVHRKIAMQTLSGLTGEENA